MDGSGREAALARMLVPDASPETVASVVGDPALLDRVRKAASASGTARAVLRNLPVAYRVDAFSEARARVERLGVGGVVDRRRRWPRRGVDDDIARAGVGRGGLAAVVPELQGRPHAGHHIGSGGRDRRADRRPGRLLELPLWPGLSGGASLEGAWQAVALLVVAMVVVVDPVSAHADPLLTCPETPVIHQVCSVATAAPNLAADGVEAVAGGVFDQATEWVVAGSEERRGLHRRDDRRRGHGRTPRPAGSRRTTG